MKNPFRSLRGITTILVALAFLSGGTVIWLWLSSNASWRTHQDAAYTSGLTLYHALQNGSAPSHGIVIQPLSDADQTHATAGKFNQISNAPRAARITNIPIAADGPNRRTGVHLSIAILSPDLVYRVADLHSRQGQTAAETTGEVVRLLASYCSNPIMVAKFGDGPWVEVQGAAVWGCDVAPRDMRLLAVLIALCSIGALVTRSLNLSSDFSKFATQLRNRRRVGGPAQYSTDGPEELREIVTAVNAYLETERAQLARRAAVLSGVSHDLGSPATRLRLRTALIQDKDLRRKLEADIDSMTGMIESVLSYTRAEMNAEAPRRLSLNALVGAIVDNYQDMSQAVRFRETGDIVVHGGQSVFMSRQGQAVMSGDREITIVGRPISLERALSNLIDNALKYGRRATVSLETTATAVTIVIEDEGSESSAKDIEALLAPYQRGENTAAIHGYGLGLTIVATIANLHGGTLSFEDTPVGVAARLMIERG